MAAVLEDVHGKVRAELSSAGEYTIGRGPLLQVLDKRVSRNHATIKLEENGKLLICSKHTNPCYHKKKGTLKYIQLEQNVWQELGDGDQISLLNYDIQELIFNVRFKTIHDEEEEEEEGKHNEIKEENKDNKQDIIDKEENKMEVNDELEKGKAEIRQDDHQNNIYTKENHHDTTNTVISNPLHTISLQRGASLMRPPPSTVILPAWLRATTSKQSTAVTTSTSVKTTSVKTSESRTPAPKKEPSKSNEPVKKKAELKGKVTEEEEEEKEEKEDSLIVSSTTGEVLTKKLPSCPYGKKCYRKNPVHFKEYSHNDKEEEEEEEEEEEGEKLECPYGTSCYRKNPLHLQQYSHTKPPATATDSFRSKGTRASTRSTRGKKKAKKSALEDDSDNDGEPNSYDYNDSFIDDEEIDGSSSSSYGADSDEDADWRAPTMEEDSENVDELLSDANDFMNNDKMQR